MMYSDFEIKDILNKLLSLPGETEIVEFKHAKNSFNDADLGKYFSALSNEANLKGLDYAWLVFGIDNKTHQLIGTQYRPLRTSLDSIKKTIADQTTGRITFEEIYDVIVDGKRVVLFQIPAAPRGIPIAYQNHFYGRDGESVVGLNIQEIERIRNQVKESDWSIQIVPEATINDLDEKAIKLARKLYREAHLENIDDIDGWDDVTFLNKAKITLKGRITNTAIVLLCKDESEHFLSPAVAEIKWILKDSSGQERDYAIFPCPLLLSVNKVYSKIRNLKYRYINPEFQTLFPEEIDTYEPYVIREAINNAIAHQDYRLGGQINVVEYDDRLVFSNKGSFIPGSIDVVLKNDAPEEYYRNRFLVNAMVGLKMVDTIGSGIKKMFSYQRKRLFPLPLYRLSPDRVEVTIAGKIIDVQFSSLLARDSTLSLTDIELLNRIQFGYSISDEALSYLRSRKLVEGRKPNVFIARSIAQTTDQRSAYTKSKGLDEKKWEVLLSDAFSDHNSLSRKEIEDILWNILPIHLNDSQKHNKIINYLRKIQRQGLIANTGKGPTSKWYWIK